MQGKNSPGHPHSAKALDPSFHASPFLGPLHKLHYRVTNNGIVLAGYTNLLPWQKFYIKKYHQCLGLSHGQQVHCREDITNVKACHLNVQ